MFGHRWADLIGSWCVAFYNANNHDAPKRAIRSMFDTWYEDDGEDATAKLIESFLEDLSAEADEEQVSASYITDLAGQVFNRARVERLRDQLEASLAHGDMEKAEEVIAASVKRVEIGRGATIDPFSDSSLIRDAVLERTESDPVVRFDGALGQFFSFALETDQFVSFMSPEKRGKTWWLQECAWNAMTLGRRVAFFSVGDLTVRQAMRRLVVRAAERPVLAGTVKVPTYIDHAVGQDTVTVDFEERKFATNIVWKEARRAMFQTMAATGKKGLFKLEVHPHSTINVAGIRSIVDRWAADGWTADVICIDYADILAPPAGYTEGRDRINATWGQLRSLSQAMHCLVLTATQSDAASYTAETLHMSNFSEDKRKIAHVTGMVGINQTPAEKEDQVYRLNWVANREGELSDSQCVYTAGCLGFGNPAILSTF